MQKEIHAKVISIQLVISRSPLLSSPEAHRVNQHPTLKIENDTIPKLPLLEAEVANDKQVCLLATAAQLGWRGELETKLLYFKEEAQLVLKKKSLFYKGVNIFLQSHIA